MPWCYKARGWEVFALPRLRHLIPKLGGLAFPGFLYSWTGNLPQMLFKAYVCFWLGHLFFSTDHWGTSKRFAVNLGLWVTCQILSSVESSLVSLPFLEASWTCPSRFPWTRLYLHERCALKQRGKKAGQFTCIRSAHLHFLTVWSKKFSTTPLPPLLC